MTCPKTLPPVDAVPLLLDILTAALDTLMRDPAQLTHDQLTAILIQLGIAGKLGLDNPTQYRALLRDVILETRRPNAVMHGPSI